MATSRANFFTRLLMELGDGRPPASERPESRPQNEQKRVNFADLQNTKYLGSDSEPLTSNLNFSTTEIT